MTDAMEEIISEKLIVAGPCSVESREQLISCAEVLSTLGIKYVRAGVWKPRSRPGGFEGLGSQVLPWLAELESKYSLKFVIEVGAKEHIQQATTHGLRNFWLGARTTTSPFLVEELAKSLSGHADRVFVKNPIAPDLALWEGAIARVAKENSAAQVIAVHRGFTTYLDGGFRNSPLWDLVIEFKKKNPERLLLCDPSHIAGKRALIAGVAQMAMDLMMDGLFIEVHPDPSKALSDAEQQLDFNQFSKLISQLKLKSNTDHHPYAELTQLRLNLEAIDRELIENIAKREELIEKIASFKRENNLSPLSLAKFSATLENYLNFAAEIGLDRGTLEQIYRVLHTRSLEIQSRTHEDV